MNKIWDFKPRDGLVFMADFADFSDTKPEIKQIPYWEVESLWYECGPMLQKAIDKQDYWTLEVVKNTLLTSPSLALTNQMQLWYSPNKFACVTQIQMGGNTGVRYCVLFLCGGEDMEAIQESLSIVGTWSKKHFGCTKFRIVGRRGWMKVLPNFIEKETIMEGEI